MKKKKHFFKKINFKIVLIIISVILFLSLAFFIIFGIKIRFAIDDELKLNLEPLEYNFFVSNKESVNFNFTVKNDNFRQCKSFCEFRLLDLRDNSITHYSNKTLKHNEVITKSFVSSAPGLGEGQLIYTFEVECKNLKSFVCFTDETPKYKSSVVIIDYNLTEEENILKDMFKKRFETLISEMNKVFIYIEENKILLERIDDNVLEKSILTEKSRELFKNLQEIMFNVENLFSIWEREDYVLLSNTFSDQYMFDILELNTELIDIKEVMITLINLENENIELLVSIDDFKNDFLDSSLQFIKENKSVQIKNTLDIIESINNYHAILTSKINHSPISINDNLKNSLNALQESTDYFKDINNNGTFLDLYYDSLVSSKINHSINLDNICDDLRILNSAIIEENNKSINLRDELYNWSLGNIELDLLLENASKSIEFDSLTKTKDFLENSDIKNKDTIMILLNDEISKKISISITDFNWTDIIDNSTIDINDTSNDNITYTISKENLLNIALLKNQKIEEFIGSYCSADPITNYSNILINKFIKTDFSLLKNLKYSIEIPEIILNTLLDLKENLPKCCTFGECTNCNPNKEIYPVLFIHGHIFNKDNTPDTAMNAFTKIQEKLQLDGIINVGELDLSIKPEYLQGIWGESERQVSVRASYYYIINYRVGSYYMSVQKSERIENYALRLAEIIELLKFRTGAEKINIVAHSMGGLVVREYISIFGEDDINKIITINTPHKGISDRVQKYCSLLGSSNECDDMSEESIFLNRLNSRKLPNNLYVIRSVGCKMGDTIGDGIVTNESAFLEGAKNYVIEGNCTDTWNTDLHTNILRPKLYPQIYELIKEILLEN